MMVCHIFDAKLLSGSILTVNNIFSWNYMLSFNGFFQENASENVVCKTAAIAPNLKVLCLCYSIIIACLVP